MEDPEDQRGRILDAAVAVLAERGIEGARLQDIGKVAGVSIGTIQYYFKTRDNLVDQALYRHTTHTLTLLRTAAGEVADPWEAIEGMLSLFVQRPDRERKSRIWLSLLHAGMQEARFLRMFTTVDTEWRKLFRDVIFRGVVAGRFAPERDVDDLVDLMAAIVDGFTAAQVSSALADPVRAERVMSTFVEMLRVQLRVRDPAD